MWCCGMPSLEDPPATAVEGATGAVWELQPEEGWWWKLPVVKADKPFQVVVAGEMWATESHRHFHSTSAPADLRPLTRGGPAHWGAPLVTQGRLGTSGATDPM